MSEGNKEIQKVLQTRLAGHGLQAGENSNSLFGRFYRRGTGFFGEPSSSNSLHEAAVHIVTLLLDSGRLAHRELESRMGGFGYTPDAVQQAVRLLSDGRIVTSRANGVSLDQDQRRLFV